MVEVPSVGERPSRVVTYATLSEIIEPRALELLELIQAEIGRSGCEKQLGAGVVLTGGGAKLGGLAALCGTGFWHAGAGGAFPAAWKRWERRFLTRRSRPWSGLAIYGYHQRLLRDAKEPAGCWENLEQAERGKN